MRRIKAPRPTPLRPVQPSPAVEAAYARALDDATAAMTADVTRHMTAAHPAEVAMDASRASEARRAFRRVAGRWQRRFDTVAPRLADYFARRAQGAVDGTLKAMLREAGFTVRFTLSAAQREVLAGVVGENVALIRSVASQYLGQVEAAVMRSVAKGGDLGGLTQELVDITGVTRRRAGNIARSQNRMAAALLTNKRYEALGVTRAKWLHSAGGKEPRLEHVAFSGKTFDVAKGAYLEGKWTWPGVEPGCRCVSVPVIPGWD